MVRLWVVCKVLRTFLRWEILEETFLEVGRKTVVRELGIWLFLSNSIFLSLELLSLTCYSYVHHAQRVVERANGILLVELRIRDTAAYSSQC